MTHLYKVTLGWLCKAKTVTDNMEAVWTAVLVKNSFYNLKKFYKGLLMLVFKSFSNNQFSNNNFVTIITIYRLQKPLNIIFIYLKHATFLQRNKHHFFLVKSAL